MSKAKDELTKLIEEQPEDSSREEIVKARRWALNRASDGSAGKVRESRMTRRFIGTPRISVVLTVCAFSADTSCALVSCQLSTLAGSSRASSASTRCTSAW